MLISELKQLGRDHTNFVSKTPLRSDTGDVLCKDTEYVEFVAEREGFPQGPVYEFEVYAAGAWLRNIFLTKHQVGFLKMMT